METTNTAYLNVIANSEQSMRGRKAENILMDMRKRGAEQKNVLPDYITYSVRVRSNCVFAEFLAQLMF